MSNGIKPLCSFSTTVKPNGVISIIALFDLDHVTLVQFSSLFTFQIILYTPVLMHTPHLYVNMFETVTDG